MSTTAPHKSQKNQTKAKTQYLVDDGGVIKEAIIKPPTSNKEIDRIAYGAEVTINYSIHLGGKNGKEILNKKDFTLTLDEGQEVKGFEEALKSMSLGEKARFTVKPNYAYGDKGNPSLGIPPNAELTYIIEVLNVKNQIWITPDGGVKKRILKEGTTDVMQPRIDYEAQVTAHLLGRTKEGNEFINTYKRGVPLHFTVGEGAIPPGLDKAVKSMQKGEIARVFLTSKWAFGTEGNRELGIEPNTDVSYEIEILDWTKGKDYFWDVTGGFDERYREALKRKEEGNVFYSKNNFRCANKKYKKALKFLEYDSDFKEDEKKKSQQQKLIIYNNLAASKLKCKKWQKVIEYTDEALKIDPHNVKALYRQGKAFAALGEWSRARNNFRNVLTMEPKNVSVLKELHDVNERERVQKQKSAKAMKFALQEMAREREAEEKAQRKLPWRQIRKFLLFGGVIICVLLLSLHYVSIPLKILS
jgi:FK506-binding protein 4/5